MYLYPRHFSSTHQVVRLRYQSGLTLIELLVSLVILGFVITIMSGAFFQVAQVVRIAENVNGQFQPQWVRLHALTDLVGNLVLPEDVERPFQGDGKGFEGFSLSLPQSDWGNVQAFRAKLEEKQQGGVDLTITVAEEKPIVVASWDIPVELEYLATDGTTQSVWPPLGKVTDALPSGVVVRARSGEQLAQMIATYNGARKAEPSGKNEMGNLFGVDIK